MVLKSDIDIEKLHNLNPENVSKIKMMLKDLKEIELLRYFNAVKDMELTIKNTENPKIILEYLFIKLSYFPSLMSIEDLISSVDSEKTGKNKHIPPEVTNPEVSAPQVNDLSVEKDKENAEEARRPVIKEEKVVQDKSRDTGNGESIEKMKKDKQIKNLTSKIQGRIISIENLEGDK